MLAGKSWGKPPGHKRALEKEADKKYLKLENGNDS
jgi:hypothetical protein